MQKLSKIQVIVRDKKFDNRTLQKAKREGYTYLTFRYLHLIDHPQNKIGFQVIMPEDTTAGELIGHMSKILRTPRLALILGYKRDEKEEMYKGWMKADRLYLIHTATTEYEWFRIRNSYRQACETIRRQYSIIHNIHIIPDKIYPQYKPYSLYCKDNPQGFFGNTTFDNFFTNIVSDKTVREILSTPSSPQSTHYRVFTLCPEEICMSRTLNLDNLTKELIFTTLWIPKNIKYTPITPIPSWAC